MIIEFYTPSKQVTEPLVAMARDAILCLHKQHPALSKAGVSFEQRRKIVTTERICQIRFFIDGKINLLSGSGDTFDKAVRKAIQKLEDAIAVYFKAHPEPVETSLAPVEAVGEVEGLCGVSGADHR